MNGLLERSNKFMSSRFYGIAAETRVCTVCEASSETESVFTQLTLNISGLKTLDGCVRHYVADELLDGSNQVFCSYCNTRQTKLRKTSLKVLPKVLYIHLMRFQFQNGGRVKSKQSVSIPRVYKFDPNIIRSWFCCSSV